MPRELRPELETLIARGHCNWATVMQITLTGGTQIHLSSSELFVDRFGITQQFLGKLEKDNLGALAMSVDEEVDQIDFTVANVDMVMGRQLTGEERKMDGARAVRGVVFIDRFQPIDAGQHILDYNFPGELLSSEITDPSVGFSLVSDPDSVIIAGRTIASEFQWREPVSSIQVLDPSDILPVGPGGLGPGRGGDIEPIRGGRYGEFDPLLPYRIN